MHVFSQMFSVLENSTVQVSEQGTRKVLYQKVVAAFPDGWMSSGQISREGALCLSLCYCLFVLIIVASERHEEKIRGSTSRGVCVTKPFEQFTFAFILLLRDTVLF